MNGDQVAGFEKAIGLKNAEEIEVCRHRRRRGIDGIMIINS
jgi:hypothetical protein